MDSVYDRANQSTLVSRGVALPAVDDFLDAIFVFRGRGIGGLISFDEEFREFAGVLVSELGRFDNPVIAVLPIAQELSGSSRQCASEHSLIEVVSDAGVDTLRDAK